MKGEKAANPYTNEMIRDALHAIIEGKRVKRIRHELSWDGKDLTGLFIDELVRSGYLPTTVGEVAAAPGERVPAFLIKDRVAYFGWVFWEQFTSWKLRKLWGSVLRDPRGDWTIQIPVSGRMCIYANEQGKIEMDIDHPPEI